MSRVLSLAGFQVTLIGRFWVIPEDGGAFHSSAGAFTFWSMLFGLSPLLATLTKQTAFCTIFAQTSHLESTLTCDPTSVDSKRLAKALTPLDAIFTKNRGGGDA